MGYYKKRKPSYNKQAFVNMNAKMYADKAKEDELRRNELINFLDKTDAPKKVDNLSEVKFKAQVKSDFIQNLKIISKAYKPKLVDVITKVKVWPSYLGTLEQPPEDEGFEVISVHVFGEDVSSHLRDIDWEYVESRVEKKVDNLLCDNPDLAI